MKNTQPPPSDGLARPQWLIDGLKWLEENKGVPFVPDRVTIDVWDYHPRTNPDDFKVVICVDGEVIGKPLSQEDGCAVINWLQDAWPELERKLLHDAEDLLLEEAEDKAEKEGRLN